MFEQLIGEYTVEYANTKVGRLTVSSQGLTARFIAECVVATAEILRLAVLVGDRYVILGVLLPDGDTLRFTKAYSKNDLRLKGLTSIDACRLVSKHDALVAPTPMPAPEPKPTPTPAPEPAPVEDDNNRPAADITAPTPDLDWELVRPLDEDAILFTHAAQIPAPEPLVIEEPVPEPKPEPAPELAADPIPDPAPPPPPIKWTPHPAPGILFTDPDLVTASANIQNAMTRPCGKDCIELAVPFEAGQPFPLLPIFCFGKAAEIADRAYLVFRIKNGSLAE
ncbi:MAG: hypothetical protein FWE08_01415 [Oscillospiraceae bacterium]|nr:hypothetical protein [Oscillospiraceae bacterium]